MMRERSDSLGSSQAIRYECFTTHSTSALLESWSMETNAERRRRKLTTLCDSRGGVEAVAEQCGLSAGGLDQIIKGVLLPLKKGDSTRSARSLGDSAARAIERALELERGWFDNDPQEIDVKPKELLLLGYFRELDVDLQTLVIENVRQTAEKRAELAESLAAALRPNAAVKPPAPRHTF